MIYANYTPCATYPQRGVDALLGLVRPVWALFGIVQGGNRTRHQLGDPFKEIRHPYVLECRALQVGGCTDLIGKVASLHVCCLMSLYIAVCCVVVCCAELCCVVLVCAVLCRVVSACVHDCWSATATALVRRRLRSVREERAKWRTISSEMDAAGSASGRRSISQPTRTICAWGRAAVTSGAHSVLMCSAIRC